MEKYLALASQLRDRLAAASGLEDMWAVKAAFDTEFAAEYKAEIRARNRAAEVAEAQAKIAELQKVVEG